MSNQLSIVDFDSLGIRWVEDDNGEKWFILHDVYRFRNPNKNTTTGPKVGIKLNDLNLYEKFCSKYRIDYRYRGRYKGVYVGDLKAILSILTNSKGQGGSEISRVIKSSLLEHLAKSLGKNFIDLWEALRTMDVSDLPPDRYVYVARESVTGRYKIGISINPVERVKQLNVGNPEQLELIHYYQANEAGYLSERAAHEVYEDHRLHGEWFDKNIDLTLLPEMPL